MLYKRNSPRVPVRRRSRARLRIEELENRYMPSANGLEATVAFLEVEDNDTMQFANDLGTTNGSELKVVQGTVGNSPELTTDVDWFHIQLTVTSRLDLSAIARGDSTVLAPTVSLYNRDPWSFFDPDNGIGNRLISRTTDTNALQQVLAAGDYFIAVSGKGNTTFHPYLAGSGTPGAAGDYELNIAATEISREATDGPVVLSVYPQDQMVLNRSPLVVRLGFDTALDQSTIVPDDTVRLLYRPTPEGAFDSSVTLSGYNFSSADELQLYPSAPLRPGYYRIDLVGDNPFGGSVLTDLNGVPMGSDSLHPNGQNFSFHFEVNGIEGNTDPLASSDDTANTSRELGEWTDSDTMQVDGAIGDDPAYDPNGLDSMLTNPASDVDFYHFQISGSERFSFSAEVFAGRIGSRLDADVSLFRQDPLTGLLEFVRSNDGTRNDIQTSNGLVPLYTDPLLYAGLTAGDYFVVVSSAGNTPDASMGLFPGVDGVFDPNVTHSGTMGYTQGQYVLSLTLERDEVAPHVVAVTPDADTTLSEPPKYLTVRFSEAVNLQQLAFQAFSQVSETTISSVFVEDANGLRFFPRLESYNPETNEARFLMLDGLVSGTYTVHLSGRLGLTDMADIPLVGNSADGDYVVSFTVVAEERGVNCDPLQWSHQGTNNSDNPQDLGVLFPHELQAGIVVSRLTDEEACDSVDCYRFEVLQNKAYTFTLQSEDSPLGSFLELYDSDGNPVRAAIQDSGTALNAQLIPGIYVVHVKNDLSGGKGLGRYALNIGLGASSDNPPPLTVGPRPTSKTNLNGLNPTSVWRNVPANDNSASGKIDSNTTGQDTPVRLSSSGRTESSTTGTTTGITPITLFPTSATSFVSTINLSSISSSTPTIPSGLLSSLGAGPIGGVEIRSTATDLSGDARFNHDDEEELATVPPILGEPPLPSDSSSATNSPDTSAHQSVPDRRDINTTDAPTPTPSPSTLPPTDVVSESRVEEQAPAVNGEQESPETLTAVSPSDAGAWTLVAAVVGVAAIPGVLGVKQILSYSSVKQPGSEGADGGCNQKN